MNNLIGANNSKKKKKKKKVIQQTYFFIPRKTIKSTKEIKFSLNLILTRILSSTPTKTLAKGDSWWESLHIY